MAKASSLIRKEKVKEGALEHQEKRKYKENKSTGIYIFFKCPWNIYQDRSYPEQEININTLKKLEIYRMLLQPQWNQTGDQ